MSFDGKSEVKCAWCSTWVCLGLDYEIRLGDEMHTACAKEWDAEHGPYCKCGHEWDNHLTGPYHTYDCVVTGCKCRSYDHAHGEHPDDHDPTDAELRAYYGPQ